MVPRKVVRLLKKSPPKFFFVACQVTARTIIEAAQLNVRLCVKKSWSLTICCWIFTKRSLFLPCRQHLSKAKKTTQNTNFFRNRTYSSYSKTKDSMFFGPFTPKETKKSTLSRTLFLLQMSAHRRSLTTLVPAFESNTGFGACELTQVNHRLIGIESC